MLSYACLWITHDFVDILLENGVVPDIKDRLGNYVIHVAFHSGIDVYAKAKMLVDMNADYVHRRDHFGATPIMHVACL